jgi:hypothetical protein
MDTFTIITFIIVLIAIVLGIIYFIWYYKNNAFDKYKLTLLKNETSFNEDYEIKQQVESLITDRRSFLVPELGYGLTFVWEMNIPSISNNDKWQSSYNKLKPIISINDSPVISYHPKKNYLSVVLKYRDNPFYAQFAEVKFDNVKLQGWNKYIIIIDNRTVKIYINNVLTASKVLPSLPVIYDINSEIILGNKNNNFLGKVRNINLYPFPAPYELIEKL